MTQNIYESPREPKRVVLLGGNGFIGTELCDHLKKNKIEFLSLSSSDIDLTKDGSDAQLSAVLKSDDILVFLSALTPDKERGLDAFSKNMNMCIHVIKALKNKPVSHLIYFSSDAVYAMDEGIVSESTTPQPTDLYGLMHLTREKLLKQHHEESLCIIRPTLVYGINDTHNAYGPNRFRRMAQNEGCITLFGKGEDIRDHIFIGDLIKIIYSVMRWKTVGELNAVSGKSLSYLDLSHKVRAHFDKEITTLYKTREQDISQRYFDNSLIFRLFPDFTFSDLDDGLALVHAQMRNLC